MRHPNNYAPSRRTIFSAIGGAFAAADANVSLLAQARPPARRRRLPHADLESITYVQDGIAIEMRVTRSGAHGNAVVELIFLEHQTVILKTQVVMEGKAGTLGKITEDISGANFSYRITIDGLEVPIREGEAPETRAKLTIQDGGAPISGSFDLRTWKAEGTERAHRAQLPSQLAAKTAPFSDVLEVSIRRERIRAGLPESPAAKPPASFWTGGKCRAACAGAAAAAVAVVGAGTAGALTLIAIFAAGAAGSYCTDHCPQ